MAIEQLVSIHLNGAAVLPAPVWHFITMSYGAPLLSLWRDREREMVTFAAWPHTQPVGV